MAQYFISNCFYILNRLLCKKIKIKIRVSQMKQAVPNKIDQTCKTKTATGRKWKIHSQPERLKNPLQATSVVVAWRPELKNRNPQGKQQLPVVEALQVHPLTRITSGRMRDFNPVERKTKTETACPVEKHQQQKAIKKQVQIADLQLEKGWPRPPFLYKFGLWISKPTTK